VKEDIPDKVLEVIADEYPDLQIAGQYTGLYESQFIRGTIEVNDGCIEIEQSSDEDSRDLQHQIENLFDDNGQGRYHYVAATDDLIDEIDPMELDDMTAPHNELSF